jgi:hypothetical protein
MDIIARYRTINKKKPAIISGFLHFITLCWIIVWCRSPGSNRDALAGGGF